MITLGSTFSGIGGFELGLERAIPNLRTIWQIEKDPFCRRVLTKHWPDVPKFDDITQTDPRTLPRPDILCGGFPCQDLSTAGKMAGLGGKKSGLWFNLYEYISVLRPSIIILENVPNVVNLGLPAICGAMAEIGYDMQWGIVSAASMGAPHLRRRWFAVAYPNDEGLRLSERIREECTEKIFASSNGEAQAATNTTCVNVQKKCQPGAMEAPQDRPAKFKRIGSNTRGIHPGNYWEGFPTQPGICRRDDGIPDRVDRIRSLGNSIVPQCAEYIGRLIVNSGLIDRHIKGKTAIT